MRPMTSVKVLMPGAWMPAHFWDRENLCVARRHPCKFPRCFVYSDDALCQLGKLISNWARGWPRVAGTGPSDRDWRKGLVAEIPVSH